MAGGHFRAMPADFMQVAPGKSLTAIRRHYSTNHAIAKRWFTEAGIEPTDSYHFRDPNPPQDFAQWAAVETSKQLQRRYGTDSVRIADWRRAAGIPSAYMSRVGINQRPIPDDFVEHAHKLTRKQLRAHYSTCGEVVTRWCREAGIEARIAVGRPPARSARCFISHTVTVMDTRDGSLASRAQSHLQRRFSVWRCTPDGTFDPKGSHFRVNGLVRTAEEMIERAKRHGFDPNEWSRLAA